MQVFQLIVQALIAIPKIAEHIERLANWVENERIRQWRGDLEQATLKLEQSKNAQEQMAATTDLRKLIERMR